MADRTAQQPCLSSLTRAPSSRRCARRAARDQRRAPDQSGSTGWRQQFLWPAIGRISGLFRIAADHKGEPGSYHSGIDIARPMGATVLAPADGVVILAANRAFTLEGNLLMIDHGAGLNSAFLHLSRIDVRVGQVVRRVRPSVRSA